MVKNFFYIEGVEKEENLKKKLIEKDSIVEIPKGIPKGDFKNLMEKAKELGFI